MNQEEVRKILSIAKTFKNYIESEEMGIKTLNNLKRISENDHLVSVLFSKLKTHREKVKVIFATYFMIRNPNIPTDGLVKIISNLYEYQIKIFTELTKKIEDCSYCDGGGQEGCYECDGDGQVECPSCDGSGKEDCYECDGSGKEDCSNCSGSGEETDYDDEGEEIEVECSSCDGSGKEDCSNCSGVGNYECNECDGSRYISCSDCGGDGNVQCSNCDGSGEEESTEDYFNINYMSIVVLGSKIKKFEDTEMTLEKFEDLNANDGAFSYELIIANYNDIDDYDYEDRMKMEGFSDDFVKIGDVLKL